MEEACIVETRGYPKVDDAGHLEKELIDEYNGVLQQKEVYWYQQSRENGLWKGSEINGYFIPRL